MRNSKITTLAFMAVTITIVALYFTNGSVTPKEATWDDVLVEAQEGGYQLISTDDLWKRYRTHKGTILLVDTRQEWEFRAGHIQGAVNFPMEPTWFSRWQKKGELGDLLGTDKDRAIIFY